MSDLLLKVVHLVKHQPSERRSAFRLGPVSFEVRAGEVLLLTGHNGSGKTTLLDCISGDAAADTGAVDAKGDIIYMSQDYRRLLLPWATCAEHLALRSDHAGNGVGWDSARPLMPKTLAAKRDVPAFRLSGGQLQALCFIQCLTAGKPIMLFDEPFSNLDGIVTELLCRELLQTVHDQSYAAVVCAHAPPQMLTAAATRREIEQGILK